MTINSATNVNDRTLTNYYNKLLRDAIMKAKTEATRSTREKREFVIEVRILEKKTSKK
jgi:hypothetical protein